MRWLVGWSSIAANFGTAGAVGASDEGRTVHPVGAQLLWGDPDPLWAVGDWRPDEVRVVKADAQTRIANYSQWRNREDFLAMLRSDEMRRRNREISGLCKSFEPVMYEVAETLG